MYYKAIDATAGKVQSGSNKDTGFVTVSYKPLTYNPVTQKLMIVGAGAPIKKTFYEDNNRDMYEAFASIIPEESGGKNKDFTKATFSQQVLLNELAKIEDGAYLFLPAAAYYSKPLGGAYVMTYATNLGEHKAGEPVMRQKEKYVRVVEEVMVFVAYAEEPTPGKKVSYLKGFDEERALESARRMLIPVEQFIAEKEGNKALVNPRYLEGYKEPVPPTDASENENITF